MGDKWNRSVLEDPRFEVPLYTMAEAARIIDVPVTTFTTWAKGYIRRSPHRPEVLAGPVVTWQRPASKGAPCIPFIGLAEAFVVNAVRRSGVSMQRVRPALDVLKHEIDVAYALASRRLYSDGAELLYNYAERRADDDAAPHIRQLVVVRNGQCVFSEIVDQYLVNIEYGPDNYASLLRLPSYACARVIADPQRSFGRPTLVHGGARVADVLDRFWTGESLADLEEEFGAPRDQLEDLLRVASRWAA